MMSTNSQDGMQDSVPAASAVTQSEGKKRWYVVHAYSGMEKSVQRALTARITRAGMQDKFGQILVPTEEVIEVKNGQKSLSERKFFPGYVLVEMEMTDETWHLVKNTAKVTGFIGGSAMKPTPISDKEVPFTDFHGNVEDVNYDKSKIRVSVSIFGRPTPVELDFSQVEKA